ncbi:MAG: hypothetical protein DA405_00550 [Bacteroidetes bacterium]|nr:MAG: hypothetical protein DA405_00550 [Bacteroidota bacterium]
MNIAESFAYPVEYSPTNNNYRYVSIWAVSGGSLNTNGFTDEAGNQESPFIY